MIEKLEALKGQLLSEDEEIRRSAVLELSGFPLGMVKELLFKAMGDASWRVRKEAVEELLKGEIGEETIEEIIGLLGSHDNAGLRNSAVEALERLGCRVVKSLCGHGSEPDHDIRKFVLDILGSIGDAAAVPLMIRSLDDPDPNVSAAAAENLGKIGDPDSVPFLLKALEKPDIWLRYTILEALGKIGSPVPLPDIAPLAEENLLKKALYDCLGSIGRRDSLPLLFEGLRERVRKAREAAVVALMRVRDRLAVEDGQCQVDDRIAELNGAPMVEGLLASLDTADRTLKESLVRLLGLVGDERGIVGLLRECSDDRIRRFALSSLKGMGERGAKGILALYPDADDDLRCIIAFVCGELHLADSETVLAQGMRNDNPLLRRVSAMAAAKGGMGRLAEEIACLVKDPDPVVRSDSIEALSLLAGEEVGTVDRIAGELAACLDPEQRRAAALLYGALRRADRLALLIKDEDAKVRKTAVGALALLQTESKANLLMMALVDEDVDVRIAAVEALGESRGEDVLASLLLALKDEDPWVKCAALKSLGKLGHKGAKDAVAEVLEGSTNGLLTITALETLASIGGEGVVERVERSLVSSDEEVVNKAMEILSCQGSAWIEEYREKLLSHPHWGVRRNFVKAMAAIMGESSIPHLRHALDSETDSLVREQILAVIDGYR